MKRGMTVDDLHRFARIGQAVIAMAAKGGPKKRGRKAGSTTGRGPGRPRKSETRQAELKAGPRKSASKAKATARKPRASQAQQGPDDLV